MNMQFTDRMRSRGRRGRRSRGLQRLQSSRSTPWLAVMGGLGLAGIGYAIWRRASANPQEKAGQMSMESKPRTSERWWYNLLPHMSEAARIDSLQALYISELQEMRHADGEVASLLTRLARSADNDELAKRLRRHEGKVEVQRRRVADILQQCGANPQAHKDDAMRALETEAGKMLKIKSDPTLRDAAIIASFQRIIHYRIATLGTLAAYAQLLGRNAEASEFAEWSDAEGKLDHDLTDLAETTINRSAKQTS